jgi:hypothetical protein
LGLLPKGLEKELVVADFAFLNGFLPAFDATGWIELRKLMEGVRFVVTMRRDSAIELNVG